MYFITTRTSAHADGSKFRVLSYCDKRETARSLAAKLEGTVRNQAELDKLIAAGRVDATTLPGYVAPEPVKSFVDLAMEVKAAAKESSTLGKREKVLKRVATPEFVLETGRALLDQCIKLSASKVNTVRTLAALSLEPEVAGGRSLKLQRRDVFTLIRERPELNEIAGATISTQFQLVRSGKYAPKS